MKHSLLVALLFALASLAWLMIAVLQPPLRPVFAGLSIANLGVALVFLRRHLSGRA